VHVLCKINYYYNLKNILLLLRLRFIDKSKYSARIIIYFGGDYLAHTPGWHINHAPDMKNHNTPQCTRINYQSKYLIMR